MLDKVSVIIVNWNCEQFIEQCLLSLLAQTVKPFEIILVDNSSSDGSVDIVRRFSSIRLIELDQNTGFAAGNNFAIKAASTESEWIALLNPDAFPSPTWLEELVGSTQNNPEFDVFGSTLVNAMDSSVLDGTGDVYHASGLVWRKDHGAEDSVVNRDVESEIFSPCAAAALYRRSIFFEANGFDEDFFCYVEDVDLGFRLRLAGHRCLYVPRSVVYHVGSGTIGGQHSDFSVYHGHRNLVWAYIKNMPGLLFWACLPLHISMNLIVIIYFILKGQGKVILKAKWDALLGIPLMWKKRQNIQKNRVVSVKEIWELLDKRLIPNRHSYKKTGCNGE